ncbi:MAG: single-stranded-DNA-specific exonuclease RecJ, partial [Acidobacteriota bacterium]
MRWLEPVPTEVPDELRAVVGGHPLIVERLCRSGINTVSAARSFLNPSAYIAASPFELPDLGIAVDRLKHAIAKRERILIWGDFDVDGQTATALLLDGLRRLAANVRYHVPLRHGEGHGMTLP